MEKLTTWWPGCTQDLSCHNSKNWPHRNRNKCTLERKINYTWNNQDDASQAMHYQLKMTARNDCSLSASFSPAPLPLSVYLSSHPLLVGDGGSWPLDRGLPPSPQVAGIWNKAKFPFHFWVVSSQSPQHTPPFGNRFWAPVLSWHLALLGLPGACCGYDGVLVCSL